MNASLFLAADRDHLVPSGLIKRVAVDHWDVERATKEATLLGQTNPTMRQFAVDYAQAHKR